MANEEASCRVNLWCQGVLVHSEFAAAPMRKAPRVKVRLLKKYEHYGVVHEAGSEFVVGCGLDGFWVDSGHGCGFYLRAVDCEVL